jgi:hypothetical protein
VPFFKFLVVVAVYLAQLVDVDNEIRVMVYGSKPVVSCLNAHVLIFFPDSDVFDVLWDCSVVRSFIISMY